MTVTSRVGTALRPEHVNKWHITGQTIDRSNVYRHKHVAWCSGVQECGGRKQSGQRRQDRAVPADLKCLGAALSSDAR